MQNNPRISVVIPTYNSWDTLKDCIGSLFKLRKNRELLILGGSFSFYTSIFCRVDVIKIYAQKTI